MKRNINNLTAIIATTLLSFSSTETQQYSCKPEEFRKIELSDTIHESAFVYEKRFRPIKERYKENKDSQEVSILDPLKEIIPPKFSVVFKCQHGKFAINSRHLYKELAENQEVEVTYKEAHQLTYKIDEHCDKKVIVDFVLYYTSHKY